MTPSQPERVLRVLLVVALSALTFVSLRARAAEVEAEAPPTSAPAAEVAPVIATAAVPGNEPASPCEGHAHELALPDGTFVAALNGATDPVPLKEFWGAGPWSPIVGVERSSVGVDWYRHADGSYSTTQRIWRSDKGEWVTMTRVAHPGPAVTPPVAK